MKTKNFPLVLAAAWCVAVLPLAAHDLYWTEEIEQDGEETYNIMASDIDGGNVTEVFDGSVMEGLPVDIVVTNDHLYWTEHAGSSEHGGIWRADRDGNNAELFVENDGSFSAPHYLVISGVHDKIYFSCYSNGLFQADLETGDNLEVLFDDFASAFTGLALRGDNDEELIWITAASPTIYRTQLPSGSTSQGDVILDVSGAGETYGVAYNPDDGHLYFTNFGEGFLYRFDFDTGESTLLRVGIGGPLGLKFSPSRTHLLIAERGKGVSAYQLDNSGYELLADAPDAHFGVAVTADPADLPAGPPPPDEGDFIFFADFEGDEVGGLPRQISDGGVWANVSSEPGAGIVTVMQDEDNVFGFGTDNQFVRYESMNGFTMDARFPGLEVATLSFDVITRFHDDDSGRWLNARMRSGNQDAHILSLRNNTRRVRGDEEIGDPLYADPELPVRMNLIVNNSTDTITYTGPDGEDHDLSSEYASLWVFHYARQQWQHLISEYQRNSDAPAGNLIDLLRFQIDSNDPLRSFDFDNIGVTIGAAITEPAEFEFPELPPVRIHTAVEVEFDTIEGVRYLVESSEDREEWTPVAAPLSGDGEPVSMIFSTRDEEPRVFRVLTSGND